MLGNANRFFLITRATRD